MMKAMTLNPKGAILSGTELNVEARESMKFMISLVMEFSLGVMLVGAGIIALIACAGH